ncbi:hypothetical protein [Endothiovibrio diazotrophicus]
MRLRRYAGLGFALWLAIGVCSIASGHGLTITTAGVTLRNGNHLMLHLQYDPLRMWHKVNDGAGGAPIDLGRLASLPDAEFEAGYRAIQAYLREGLTVRAADRPLTSPQFRFPPAAEFRRVVREGFMRRVLAAKQGGGHFHEDARHDYQSAWLDGFLPEGSESGELELHFPPALGEVMVTYSRPRSWTLRPDEGGIRLRFAVAPPGK